MKTIYPIFAALAISAGSPVLAEDTPVEGGTGNTQNCFPFGCEYNGIYQQVYSASEFAELENFDTLTFYADQNAANSNNLNSGTYEVDFYYSANSVDGLSGTFANNLGEYIGSFGVFTLSGESIDKDNPLTFSGSLLNYDSSLGDLLMSINVSSTNSGLNSFLDAHAATDSVSRAYNRNGYLSGDTSTAGLVTGFSVQGAVPEPSTWMMLLIGFFGVGGALRSKQSKMTTRISYS